MSFPRNPVLSAVLSNVEREDEGTQYDYTTGKTTFGKKHIGHENSSFGPNNTFLAIIY